MSDLVYRNEDVNAARKDVVAAIGTERYHSLCEGIVTTMLDCEKVLARRTAEQKERMEAAAKQLTERADVYIREQLLPRVAKRAESALLDSEVIDVAISLEDDLANEVARLLDVMMLHIRTSVGHGNAGVSLYTFSFPRRHEVVEGR